MRYHKTEDGRKIKLEDLEIGHLKNIIKWIDNKSKEGYTVKMGGGYEADDMWYFEETLRGKRAKIALNFYDYKDELSRRIKTP